MQTLNKIKTQLEALKPTLREKFEVETIDVFGYYSHSEQTKKSDINILITFSEDAHIGFFKFLELEDFLSKQLGVRVDLVTKDALKPMLSDRILKKTVYA